MSLAACPRRVCIRLAAILLLAGLSIGTVSAASFFITADTSSVAGTHGYIDLQFNPGDTTTQAATANILNLEADGGMLDYTSVQISGDVTTSPGLITENNDTPYNDYFQGLTYGTSLSFLVILSGPAIDNPDGVSTAGSTFGVGFYDSGSNSILTDDASGFAGEVNINLDGTTTPVTFLYGGELSVATIQLVPEPSTLWLGAGIIGMLCVYEVWRARWTAS